MTFSPEDWPVVVYLAMRPTNVPDSKLCQVARTDFYNSWCIDTSIAEVAPAVTVQIPHSAEVGKEVGLSAAAAPVSAPVLSYRWDFGDGTCGEGTLVRHAFTHAGSFTVHLTAEGSDGVSFNTSSTIFVTGSIDPRFAPNRNKRYVEEY